MNTSTRVLEAQLDWLTCSYRGAGPVRALRQFASDMAPLEARNQDDSGPFRLNGYVGWRIGRVRYGERDNAALIQLSGQLAEDWAATLLPDATTITRLDVAVTARITPWDPTYLDAVEEDLHSYYRDHPSSARPSHTADADGGHTCYVGSRRSPVYARVYSKHYESRDSPEPAERERYEHTYRWELEYHDAASSAVGVDCLRAHPRAAFCSGNVFDYFNRHGHQPPFDPLHQPVHAGGFRRRSDYQSRLRWFARAVAPSIDRAMAQGDRAEVLRALGLGVNP